MNIITRPSTSLPTLLSDWLSPSRLFDREFFDMDPDQFTARLGINLPTVNFSENKREYMLELAAPGLERKDFNIELENHILTISVRKEEIRKEEDSYYKREYSFTSFSRSFSLPENIKEDVIDAKYENGILKVMIPKIKETETHTTKKITVS
jgi:HSP20 family protein